MRYASRILILLGIAAIALASALPYRQAAAPVPVIDAAPPLERRATGPIGSYAHRFQDAGPEAPKPLVVAAVAPEFASRPTEPESDLPSSYHHTFSPVGALLQSADTEEDDRIGERPSPAETFAADQPLTHRVVDGDTLTALAKRYLGDAARAEEIFELNRELLKSPDLLPIGKPLKLPPRERNAGSNPLRATELASPDSPLVPIPRGVFGREAR